MLHLAILLQACLCRHRMTFCLEENIGKEAQWLSRMELVINVILWLIWTRFRHDDTCSPINLWNMSHHDFNLIVLYV